MGPVGGASGDRVGASLGGSIGWGSCRGGRLGSAGVCGSFTGPLPGSGWSGSCGTSGVFGSGEMGIRSSGQAGQAWARRIFKSLSMR